MKTMRLIVPSISLKGRTIGDKGGGFKQTNQPDHKLRK